MAPVPNSNASSDDFLPNSDGPLPNSDGLPT